MSANIDLVRSIYAKWERGEFGSAEWAHPAIEYIVPDGPEPGSWTGIAAMAAAFRDHLRAWEDCRVEASDLLELDTQRVLALVRFRAGGKSSAVEVDQDGAEVFHLHDARVTRLVSYWDRHNALADLGLQEHDVSQQNLRVVRRFYELWNERDIDGMAALFDAGATVYPPDRWPDGSPFRGPEAIAVGTCALLEGFDDATISLEESTAHEQWVMTHHHAIGRGDHSGLVAEFHSSAAFSLRDGKITEARFYWERADALKAVGLEE